MGDFLIFLRGGGEVILQSQSMYFVVNKPSRSN